MLELEGRKYSKEPFDDYTHRARVKIEVAEIKNHTVVRRETHIEVYTTNANREDVQQVLFERASENVTKLEIDWWATREQDDAAAKFIEEFLNDDFKDA